MGPFRPWMIASISIRAHVPVSRSIGLEGYTMCKLPIWVVVFSVAVASIAVSEPADCNWFTSDDVSTLNDYVWLQRFAFTFHRPDNICRDEYGLSEPTPWDTSGLKKVPLIPPDAPPNSSWIDRHIRNIEKRWDIGPNAELYASRDRNGHYRYHLSCFTEDPKVPRLAISITQFVQYVREFVEGHPVTRRLNHILFDGAVIVTDEFLKSWDGEEIVEIRVIRAWPKESKQRPKESLFLIRGTRLNVFRLIPNLRASINAMIDGSCAFPLALQVAIEKSHEYRGSRFTVVGHSLGGAVATYIAGHHRDRPSAYGGWGFSAYSFSAVGVRKGSQDGKPIYGLHNFHIDGDPVAWVGLEQVGKRYVYYPQKNAGLGDRHSLENVQRSLCACLSSKGQIEVSPP